MRSSPGGIYVLGRATWALRAGAANYALRVRIVFTKYCQACVEKLWRGSAKRVNNPLSRRWVVFYKIIVTYSIKVGYWFLATADAVLGLALVAALDLRFVRALAGLASGAPPIV